MARMLGRYESPGCCPGTREGWRRTRKRHSQDCSGALTDVRKRKRQEKRKTRREIEEDSVRCCNPSGTECLCSAGCTCLCELCDC